MDAWERKGTSACDQHSGQQSPGRCGTAAILVGSVDGGLQTDNSEIPSACCEGVMPLWEHIQQCNPVSFFSDG